MPENEPPFDPIPEALPAEESITPPSPLLPHPPDEAAVLASEWQPELGLPERTLTQKPRWPHPNFGWSFLWCLLFVFATQGPGIFIALAVVAVLAIVSPSMLPQEKLNNPEALLKSQAMSVALAVAFFFTELLVIGFSWLIIRLVVGREWKRQLALRRPSLSHTLLALVSLPALSLLAGILYDVLRSLFHMPDLVGMKEAEKIFSTWPWAFGVLVIGLGPGIGEELWCRGFLGRGLVGHYGIIWGVLASSFFFGLIHLDPSQGTMAMLIGLWLHFVYLTTRSLLLPMLLHFLNNSLSVLAQHFSPPQLLNSEPQDVPLLIYVTGLFLLGSVAYALYQSRARLAAQSPDLPTLWRPAFEGVEYPPAGSGVRVLHPLPSALASVLVCGAFLSFIWACVSWFSQG